MACLIFMTLSFFVGWHGHYEVNSMISKNGMSNAGLYERLCQNEHCWLHIRGQNEHCWAYMGDQNGLLGL